MSLRRSNVLSLTWLIFVLGAGSACAHKPPAFEAGQVAHGKLARHGKVWVLDLQGGAKERGRAAGQLLGKQIRWLLPRYLKQAIGVPKLPPSFSARLDKMSSGMAESHRVQVQAMAEAAAVDAPSLLAVNLATELSASLACSCLATLPKRSEDGRIRLGRNLDWRAGNLLAHLALVVVERGPERSFASITWPGLVGVVSGMNDKGLAVADLMAYGDEARTVVAGVPVMFAVRTMLERAATVVDALAWLKTASRTMPQNYALADPGDARVVETGPGLFRVRPARKGLAGITNYYDEDRGASRDGRYARMFKKAGAERKLGRGEVQAILRSVALGQMNVQAIVFEPALGKIVFSAQSRPAAQGPWLELDLKPLLAPSDLGTDRGKP